MFCKLARLVALLMVLGVAYLAYDSRAEMQRYLKIRSM